MNISIPIELLTDQQIDTILKEMVIKFNAMNAHIIKSFSNDYLMCYIEDFIDTGVPSEKRDALQSLIENLDESDQEDLFGTEGWKVAFLMD